MNENIHKGHRERVKERFIREGLDNFEDHQILELLLFYCIPYKDTNELAHKILQRSGTLHYLFESHPIEIVNRCGVSLNTAVLLSMVSHLSRKYYKSKWENKPVLDSSKAVGSFAVSLFAGKTVETLFVICLDTQRRLNFAAQVIDGTVDALPFYPRKIIETALQYQAAGIILAHNHPGGSLKPSRSDIEATNKIITALDIMSIELVDHIIIAGEKYSSFAEQRLCGISYY